MNPDELEDFYRQRSLLKRQRPAGGHRRGVYFLASDPADEVHRYILNVDAGNAVSFTR